MLRRVAPSATVARCTVTKSVFALSSLSAAVRGKAVCMSEPIGNGKVIPRKFDYVRPAYSVPTWPQWCTIISLWLWSTAMPGAILVALVLWTFHGGFTGHLPPDPHEIHK